MRFRPLKCSMHRSYSASLLPSMCPSLLSIAFFYLYPSSFPYLLVANCTSSSSTHHPSLSPSLLLITLFLHRPPSSISSFATNCTSSPHRPPFPACLKSNFFPHCPISIVKALSSPIFDVSSNRCTKMTRLVFTKI